MSTIGASVMTLADYAKGLGPDHKIARVTGCSTAERSPRGHRFPRGEPAHGHADRGAYRDAHRLLAPDQPGVATSKSTKAQIDALCGRMERGRP
jgi:hypothetical protein